MRREEIDVSQPFVLFKGAVRSREEAVAEMGRPCGRFKPITSTEEELRSFIVRHIGTLDTLSGHSLSLGSDMPLNWQLLLSYLHEQKILASPHIERRSTLNDRPQIYNVQLIGERSGTSAEGGRETIEGFGGSRSREESISKAVGETLERYYMRVYDPASLAYATEGELTKRGAQVLDMKQLNGFLDWQKKRFPLFAYDEHSPLYWIQGEELESGAPIYLPAQMVFWGYSHPDAPEEKVLLRQTTSGSAGHFSKDEAVLAALLEAIQRDGFLIYWMNSLSPKVIAAEMIEDRVVKDFLAYLRRYDLEVIFLDTTSDIGIPTATCVLIDHRHEDGPVIALGSATGFDLKSTVVHSAIEALLVSGYATTLETFVLPEQYEPFVDRRINRIKRLGMWKGKNMLERFRFFISGPRENPETFLGAAHALATPRAQLSYVLDRLHALGEGYEVYTYEAHHPGLDTLGYHVVRAIVPQLIPLHLVEHVALLDSKRLREVPAKLGYEAAKEFNPWPHPFP